MGAFLHVYVGGPILLMLASFRWRCLWAGRPSLPPLAQLGEEGHLQVSCSELPDHANMLFTSQPCWSCSQSSQQLQHRICSRMESMCMRI